MHCRERDSFFYLVVGEAGRSTGEVCGFQLQLASADAARALDAKYALDVRKRQEELANAKVAADCGEGLNCSNTAVVEYQEQVVRQAREDSMAVTLQNEANLA